MAEKSSGSNPLSLCYKGARFFCRTLDDLPTAEDQLEIFNSLTDDKADHNMHKYEYKVSTLWHTTFMKYLGQCDIKRHPGVTMHPSAISMHEDEEGNQFIPGYQWRQLVSWYGVHPKHELDRRKETFRSVQEQEFVVCFLNAFMGKIKHRTKTWKLDEKIGFVEFQIRRVLGVGEAKESRLWLLAHKETEEESDIKGKQMEPLLVRLAEIADVYDFDQNEKQKYCLALEVKDGNGCWPTGSQDEPIGNFEQYSDITEGYLPIRKEKSEDIAHFRNGPFTETERVLTQFNKDIESLLKKTVESSEKKLQSQINMYEKLAADAMDVTTAYREKLQELSLLKENILQEQTELEKKLEKKRLECIQEKELLTREKTQLESEKRILQEFNCKTEDRVILNIGGHIYETTRKTLTSKPDTLLSVLFSGKYPTKRLEDGSYFFDRNGEQFKYILEYLRTSEVPPELLNMDAALRTLLLEADFYNISGLVDGIQRTFPETFPFLEWTLFTEEDEEFE